MDKFISFQKAENQLSYFFNKNHFLVLMLSLVVIIFFSMYISRQRTKIQKIHVFVVSLLILILEGLRIFWNYKFLEFNNEALTFENITNLDFFTISLWISLPFLIVSSFVKKKDKHNIFGLNFVFNVCSLFAIITLIYPININTNFEFYHCYNIMYMLLRSFIIMLGLMFAFAKWITVENFLDLWKGLFSLALLFVVCYLLTTILNLGQNIFYLESFPAFDSLGLHLPAPWHTVLMFIFLFAFQVVLHLPFFIHKSYKLKHGGY